jgi:hypothetical protein
VKRKRRRITQMIQDGQAQARAQTSPHRITNGGKVYRETLENAEMFLMMLQKDLGREQWKGPMGLRIQGISAIGELGMSLRAARAEKIWIEGIGFRLQQLANLL